MNTAKFILDGQEYELPIVVGSEGEQGIDITQLRAKTNFVTVDSGFGNTSSCTSAICFINGEKGILRYRGYPIEQLGNVNADVPISHVAARCPRRSPHGRQCSSGGGPFEDGRVWVLTDLSSDVPGSLSNLCSFYSMAVGRGHFVRRLHGPSPG